MIRIRSQNKNCTYINLLNQQFLYLIHKFVSSCLHRKPSFDIIITVVVGKVLCEPVPDFLRAFLPYIGKALSLCL